MLIFVSIALAVLNLTVAWYVFQWYRAEHSNRNIFIAWTVAFVAYAVSNVMSYLLFVTDPSSPSFLFFRGTRFLFFAIALTLIYWGAIRLVSHQQFWQHLLPILYFFAATLYTVFALGVFDAPRTFSFVAAYAFMVPMELFLAMLFFFLFGILLGEQKGRVVGPLWIAVGFLTLAIESTALPFVAGTPSMPSWFLFRVVSVLFMFVGLIRLRREISAHLRTLREPSRRYVSAKRLS